MRCGALCLRNQRIGGFLNAVMLEVIGALGMENEFGPQRVLQIEAQLFVRRLVDYGQSCEMCAVAQARKLLEDALSANGQSSQLADHEVDNVVCVALLVNAI